MPKSNYLQLVNAAILESGADLQQYNSNGSDFVSNTDSLMRKFKVWTNRAWRTIQQEADDWHFLTSRAVVNVDPRIMFYTYGKIPGTVPPFLDIYDDDDNFRVQNLAISSIVDITGQYSGENPRMSYGYVNIAESATPITFGLKPGNDWFYLNGRLTENTYGNNLNVFYDNGIGVGATLSVAATLNSDPTQPGFLFSNAVTITVLTPNTNDFLRGTTQIKFQTNNRELRELIDSGDYTIGLFPNPTNGNYTAQQYLTNSDPNNVVLVTLESTEGMTSELVDTKAYIHSWGSYDWNEELALNDFSDDVKEVNDATYKIIRTSYADPGCAEPLICVPWQQFLEAVDGPQDSPSDPALIAHDSQGRWRLWPYPKERVTVTFDYVRSPQVLDLYTDVALHLPEEYEDIIVWQTLIFYGQFSEQPNVIMRATKELKNLMYRFEKNKRPTFNFQPIRIGRRW